MTYLVKNGKARAMRAVSFRDWASEQLLPAIEEALMPTSAGSYQAEMTREIYTIQYILHVVIDVALVNQLGKDDSIIDYGALGDIIAMFDSFDQFNRIVSGLFRKGSAGWDLMEELRGTMDINEPYVVDKGIIYYIVKE